MTTPSSILSTLDTSPIPLSPKQTHILQLLATIDETRLQSALLRAHSSASPSTTNATTPVSPETLKAAERSALEARALYTLTRQITTHTITAGPILNATHASPKSSLDKELARAVHARDVLNLLTSAIASQVREVDARVRSAERDVKAGNENNVSLASQVVSSAQGLRRVGTEDVEAGPVRKRLEEVDKEIAEKRREWRVRKSLVAGVVVGSGVKWAENEALVELVLDDEDELREVRAGD
ncbi:hypothetical protein BT63DRAFT_111486 [Microthyrium microscopicum]|uniref:Centromere protein H C-terminal domain-containing protein n=1 Tax=Microthyrium microscopicum TaxID=703497 RepID=A0A6A6TX62_9PEZI|nr:hypothetical protein BT63DRAFT_111486 [Microthyrium microscopicum]